MYRPSAGDNCKDFNADRICDDNTQVRKTPSLPRSWANFSVIERYPRRNARANGRLLGRPNTLLAPERQIGGFRGLA